MTRDDIIRMAREACETTNWKPGLGNEHVVEFMERFAALVAAAKDAEHQQANHLTIERLRDALVASRIIDPAAVEDPDEYDDGVALHRIEALHRRLT